MTEGPTFLRVSDRSEDEAMECDSYPRFQRDVWPLIQGCKDRVERVLLWRNQHWGPGKWSSALFEYGNALEPFLGELGPLDTLERSVIDDVGSYCLGGHLNVFFEIADPWLRVRLRRLWPRTAVISRDRSDLALAEADYRDLARAVTHIPPESTWSAFAGEGEVLFLFGAFDILKTLVDSGLREGGSGQPLKSLYPAEETPD